MQPEVRQRLVTNNNQNRNQQNNNVDSSDEDEPIDPELLKVFDEPLPTDREGGFSLPYERRTIWSLKQVYTALLIFTALVIIVLLFLSNREIKQLEEKAAIHGVKNAHRASTTWWTHALMYKVDVRSFYDTNNDGLGDIQGIIEKLDYLKFLKIDALILSPIYLSAMLDHGRDITDFRAVDHRYGTMKDFEQLVQDVHDKDMKLIMELVPNHSSHLHLWFTESCKGGDNNKYKDYYTWHRGRVSDDDKLEPPNNWISRYGNSSWTWDEQRSAYYLHQYLPQMPDLNHRNPLVRNEFQDIVEFWIRKGIDGIHFDGVDAIFEVDDLTLDEPLQEDTETHYSKNDYGSLQHVYTHDQPEMHEYMATWRELIEHLNNELDKKLSLSIDLSDGPVDSMIHYYLTGADFPVAYALSAVTRDSDAHIMQDLIDQWADLPDTRTAVWALSSEWHGRIASRLNDDYSAVIAMVQLLLPGAAIIYYGDEIAMTHPNLKEHHSQHSEGTLLHKRDAARSPMQWTPAVNAGFSKSAKLWLPIGDDYLVKNVHTLQSTKHQHGSILHLYHELALLRRDDAFQYGQLQYALVTEDILSFMRYAPDEAPYLIAVNVGTNTTTDDYTFLVGMEFGEMVIHTHRPKDTDITGHAKVDLSALKLRPAEGVVIKLF